LLFFTKGSIADNEAEHFHTDTIWFYEHPYPEGYKSYSKTKPIRFEEFKSEQEWWGAETRDFASRVESEFAWKVDFKANREKAEAAAQPHWHRAAELNKHIAALESEINDLRRSLGGAANAAYREKIELQIAEKRLQVEPLRPQAREAQAAGDRIYWPIYNLDIKNPNSPEEETQDPDRLLENFKRLLGEIEEAENRLKSELTAALAHHFVDEEV
jgi:type I restriction enzyme M protein